MRAAEHSSAVRAHERATRWGVPRCAEDRVIREWGVEWWAQSEYSIRNGMVCQWVYSIPNGFQTLTIRILFMNSNLFKRLLAPRTDRRRPTARATRVARNFSVQIAKRRSASPRRSLRFGHVLSIYPIYTGVIGIGISYTIRKCAGIYFQFDGYC